MRCRRRSICSFRSWHRHRHLRPRRGHPRDRAGVGRRPPRLREHSTAAIGTSHDQPAVMGANSMQWAEYMRDHVGVDLSPQEIYDGVIDALRVRYARASAAHPRGPGGGDPAGAAVPAGRGLFVPHRAHRVLAWSWRGCAGISARWSRPTRWPSASRRRMCISRRAPACTRSPREPRPSRIPPTA